MIFTLPIVIVLVIFILLALFNKYLPRWFCDYLGWHLAPRATWSDGCSFTGICPRCGKKLLQDSMGNWF